MAGIAGYLHNVGPEPTQVVSLVADVFVVTTFTIDVEVEN